MITIEYLNNLPQRSVFAKGTFINSPEDIYITDYRKGDKMKWVAVRGEINDWAIYCYWDECDFEYCKDYGNKIYTPDYIKKLVPCDDKALNRYRF